MAKFQQAMIAFQALVAQDFESATALGDFIRPTGLGFAVAWPANPNTALGAVNAFVYPPMGYEKLSPVFVTADDEGQLIEKLIKATPRLLKDLADTEIVLAADVEYVIPDRAKIKRDAIAAARKAAKAAAEQGITNGARKVALQAA